MRRLDLFDAGRLTPGQVDAELFRGAEDIFIRVAHLDGDTAGIDHAVATVRRFFAEAPAAGAAAGRTGPY